MEKKINLWLIPTDKPSRLYLGDNGNFVFGMLQTSIQSRNDDFKNQNTYITNDEEIKIGDWFLGLQNQISKATSRDIYGGYERKIILTTDQDLIADGVQAIDDDFLKWFVGKANDSGKPIDVIEIQKDKCLDTSLMCDCVDEPCRNKGYKIVIPKEEPNYNMKEEILAEMERFEEQKKETLEEFAKKAYLSRLEDCLNVDFEDGVKLGAKLQEKQTIEEVFEWLTTKNYLTDLKETMIKDFNKFKNK
jgi:hypothetical protein